MLVDLKKLVDIVSKKNLKDSVQQTKYKSKQFRKENHGASILIQTNQYNTGKNIWRKNFVKLRIKFLMLVV